MTYPDGRTVEQDYDNVDRMSAVRYQQWAGSAKNESYIDASLPGSYDAGGHLVSATLGNGVPFTAVYDARERVSGMMYGASSAPAWARQYSWTPNSNVSSYTDLISGVQRQFGYDSLNRLLSAQDIFSTLAVPSGSNGYTGSTSYSESGATSINGAGGAAPLWTNPDDSNLLPDVGDADSNWHTASLTTTLPGGTAPDGSASDFTAPDGTSSATRIDPWSGSTDPYFVGDSRSTVPYVGETINGSVWLRSPSGPQSLNIYVIFRNNGSYTVAASKTIQLTPSWQQYQLSGNVGQIANAGISNDTNMELQIGGAGSLAGGHTLYIWSPKLEDAGTAGRTVTNYLPYSQRMTAATWSVNQGTLADNVGAAPDGTSSAASLTASAGSIDTYALDTVQNPALFAGTKVNASVWLRGTAGQQLLFTLYERYPGGGGAIGSAQVTLSSEWQRFEITAMPHSTLSQFQFQLGGANTLQNGASVYAWGGQLEIAGDAGPYVATGSTSASMSTTLTNLLPFSQKTNGSSWQERYKTSSVDNTGIAPDGSKTAATMTASADSSVSAYITNAVANPELYALQTVTASVYLRSMSGNMNTWMWVLANDSPCASQMIAVNTSWQRFSLTCTLPAYMSNLYIQVGNQDFAAGASMSIWGAQMEIASVAGPYIATSALPVITGRDLVNVLPNSQVTNGPGWGPVGSTAAVNAAVAPDGTQTAAVISAGAGQTDAYITDLVPNPSLYDGQTVTTSVYLRSNSGTMSILMVVPSYGDSGQHYDSKTITLTPDWQRFSITSNLQNGLTALYLQVGGATTFQSGQTFQIWGPQVVVGSDPGAYSPTSSGTTVIATGQPGTLVPYGLNEVYSYDSFGNLLQNGSFNTTYNNKNQMNGYAYDAAGNLLADHINYYAWDAENRISSAGGATYLYDAMGQRVEKIGVGDTYTFNFGGRPVARYSGGQWTDLIYGPLGAPRGSTRNDRWSSCLPCHGCSRYGCWKSAR